MDKPRLFKIILSSLQAHQFHGLLDQAKAETAIEGVVCTVARHYDSASGGSIVELQGARLSRSAIRRIQKIISEELAPKKEQRRLAVTSHSC